MILLADIGATNARFSVTNGGSLYEHSDNFQVSEYNSLQELCIKYLEKYQLKDKVNKAVIGVAAPVINDEVSFVNASISFSTQELKEELFKKIFVPLNLNTTNEKDFKMIPGVGDRMAHEFEEYRPYKSIQQFKREIGKYVDEIEVSRYLSYIFVPVELNTSSEDNIKDLPGVGNKMAHEFVEYRPYMNLSQFRREIGKYVDDKELIRLERFVYLKEQ